MMVTFVSQCEKNALKKTRRVLDAFANRIGDNTWQTLITEDGLDTVKKMLRQTASRSTAVSCHWIRSRSRSQLLWVVGNKSKFNSEGVVPVNSTEVIDIKADEKQTMIEKPIANSYQQPLHQHLFAVGWVAKYLVGKLIGNEKLAIAAEVAGYLHDIGKLDPQFQEWIQKKGENLPPEDLPDDGVHIEKGKFSWENHARHNEISWLVWKYLNQQNDLNLSESQREFIEHAIFWHHTKPVRKVALEQLASVHKKLSTAVGDKLSIWFEDVLITLEQVQILAEQYASRNPLNQNLALDEASCQALRKHSIPDYKSYSDVNDSLAEYATEVRFNANAALIRTILITADRLVSALAADELTEAITSHTLEILVDNRLTVDSQLENQINRCLTGFEMNYPDSERNRAQSQAAKELAEIENIAVLHGPAGVGKTKIALEWAQKTKVKRIIWVCPRVQVCQSLYKDLLENDYLPDGRIEICTGEIKRLSDAGVEQEVVDGGFIGDIVLTTIDQMLNATVSHSKATAMVEFLNSHVVFDEFHEYIQQPAFNLLFAELIECKKYQQRSNTILVSATPNYAFIESLLGIDAESQDVVIIKSFNPSRYQLQFEVFDDESSLDSHPLYRKQPSNSIVISNTAYAAQLGFIANQNQEKAVLYHSRFKTSDKLAVFEVIHTAFRKGGTKAFGVLRSGPIVQASLNITCEHMVSEFTLAENWLQRLGRLDRFGENAQVNTFITAVPKNVVEGKGESACTRFLSSLNAKRSADAWLAFLQDNLPSEPVTLSVLYGLYFKFYEKSSSQRQIVEEDLLASLKKSTMVINAKVHDPMSAKTRTSTAKKAIKKRSLRGDSRFVQMACLKVRSDKTFSHTNQYATDEEDVFTISVDEILGFDESSDKNLLAFMHQKHHQILNAQQETSSNKPAFKAWLLKDQALLAESPIYLSYTANDLALIHTNANENAIYYAIGETQPIGAISLEKLNSICNQ